MDAKILVVDDEVKLLKAISAYLRSEGFAVHEAARGSTALDIVSTVQVDLIVLDVMLPDMSGFDVCREIRRQNPDVPILFLTTLSDDDNHILGYRVGADDYISKPFKISILAMKARRILEKRTAQGKRLLRYSRIALDIQAHTCAVAGQEVTLTSKEFDLLHLFLENPGRVLTRKNLLENVWNTEYDGDIRVVDALIKRLRKKLGPEAEVIRTITAVGYKLEENA